MPNGAFSGVIKNSEPALKTLTAERLREVLDYDPDTGVFTWKVARGRGVKAGDIAGYADDKGYRRITVDGREHLAGRVSWLHVCGCWPTNEIDHKNGIRSDDRFTNLRDVTHSLNQQNKRQAQCNNKTGLLGVSRSRNNFTAYIKIDGKTQRIGTFDTPKSAHEAYIAAKRRLHEGCTL